MRGERIPVDILTCDPKHNIRCAQMVEVLDLLPPEVLEIVERRVWTLRTGEGRRAFQVFKGKMVPTMCVDGHKCFENRVPTTDELYLAIATAARNEEQREIVSKAWAKANAEEAPVKPDLAHHHS